MLIFQSSSKISLYRYVAEIWHTSRYYIDLLMQLQSYQGGLKNINKHRNEVGLEPLNIYLRNLEKIYIKNSIDD